MADLKLARITALIGPQASGKSVISKLVYFFYEVLSSQYLSVEDRKNIDEFKCELSEKFKKWFPPSAWGDKKFSLKFEAKLFSVTIERRVVRKNSKEKIHIEFSEYFDRHYKELLSGVAQRSDSGKEEVAGGDVSPRVQMDLYWKIRESSERKLRKDLKESYFEQQFFVPAGRSFFTSIGKAVAAFEQGGILDPVTVQFGRLFASLRDSYSRRVWFQARDRVDAASRIALTQRLFGGGN